MKNRWKLSAYKKYVVEQIMKAQREDSILLFATKMLKARDEQGVNLFWDDVEETFFREYVEDIESGARC